MKILFLDVDGVLNNAKTTQRFYCRGCRFISVDPELLDLFKKILDATDAKIVVSSTWRLDEESMTHLEKMMGRKMSSKIIGQTPSLHFRKDEINRWFANNKNITVESFVVLDDARDQGLQDFGENFVQTNEYEGLTEELVDKCIKILNKD
jgi:hypothetical protein